MKTIKHLFQIVTGCFLIFAALVSLADANADQKHRTEVNTVTHTWGSGRRKEVYRLRPARCDVWVEVNEPPEDAELDKDQFADADKMVDPQDVELLAIAIYCEAGADYISDGTRYMVGDVILNRVADDRFPGSIAAVLTQKAQYGRFYWTGIVWPERAENASEVHAVARAREIAENLLTDAQHSKLYGEGYIYQAEFTQGKDNVVSDGIIFGR